MYLASASYVPGIYFGYTLPSLSSAQAAGMSGRVVGCQCRAGKGGADALWPIAATPPAVCSVARALRCVAAAAGRGRRILLSAKRPLGLSCLNGTWSRSVTGPVSGCQPLRYGPFSCSRTWTRLQVQPRDRCGSRLPAGWPLSCWREPGCDRRGGAVGQCRRGW